MPYGQNKVICMINDYPVLTPLKICPVCGEKLDPNHKEEDRIFCSSNHCDYSEHFLSGPIVSQISNFMMAYAKQQNILAVKIKGHELQIHEAFRPDALLPLLVEKAYRSYKLSGLNSIEGLEFPLRSIEDKHGLIKYRVIYSPVTPYTSFHNAAMVVADSFEELLVLTQKLSSEQYKDFVDFDILLDRMSQSTSVSAQIEHSFIPDVRSIKEAIDIALKDQSATGQVQRVK